MPTLILTGLRPKSLRLPHFRKRLPASPVGMRLKSWYNASISMRCWKKLDIRLVRGEYKAPAPGPVTGPEQVYATFRRIERHAQEHFIGVYLDSDLQVCHYDVLGIGTSRETALDVPAIFGRAFVFRTPYLLLLHNHPSGRARPSECDRAAIRGLIAQCRVMEVRLLDFIVVGDGGYWSLSAEIGDGDYAQGAVV